MKWKIKESSNTIEISNSLAGVDTLLLLQTGLSQVEAIQQLQYPRIQLKHSI